MRIGSLFSGYGGLDLAALELFPGSSIAWHCEWDDAPSKILAHHWPDVPNHRDVTTIDWASVEPIDILTGGYPCQPFSAAGRRQGTDDERHLWPYVREAIRGLRPRFTLLENVAGHRSMGFDRVLGDCAEDGLHVRWTSLRASDVGACHRRERLFILVTDPSSPAVSEHTGEPPAEEARTNPGDRSGDPRRERSDEVGGEVTADTNDRSRHREWTRPESQSGSATAADAESRRRSGVDDRASLEGARGGRERQPCGSAGRAIVSVTPLLSTPQARDYKGVPADGFNTNNLCRDVQHLTEQWGEYESAIRRQERLSRPAPSPTNLSAKGNPRLAPEFAEWMQFLPAGHVTDPAIRLSRNDQLKAIGNGVCPPQAVAAYRSMLQAVMA